jgi:lipoate-protein ligase A
MQPDRVTTARQESDWLAALVRAEQPGPRLLLCHYTEAGVVFGLSQRPTPAETRSLDEHGLPWLRRRAGGGAVFVGPWLYAVSLLIPSAHPRYADDAVQAYQWFGAQWQRLLAELGVESRLPASKEVGQSRSRAEKLGVAWACYGAVGHGELVTPDGRKLLGIAQIRTRWNIALVAGIHVAAVPWHGLCEALERDARQADILADINARLGQGTAPTSADDWGRRLDARLPGLLAEALAVQA